MKQTKNKWKGKLLRELLLFGLSDNEKECVVQFVGQLLTEEHQRLEEKIKEIEGLKEYDTGDHADPFFSEPRAYNKAIDKVLSILTKRK